MWNNQNQNRFGEPVGGGGNNKNANTIRNSPLPINGGGGNKNNNQLVQRPDNYKGNDGLRPEEEEINWGEPGAGAEPELPAWLRALIGAAGGGAQNLLPESKKNNELARRPLWMRSDQLSPHSAPKNFNQLAPHDQGGGGSPFSSSYGGGRWGGGGGGGGGGWNGGGGGNYPEWMRSYMRLNSWNIG